MNCILLIFFASLSSTCQAGRINIFNPIEAINKTFFTQQVSVSKFPPVFEFFVQKFQSQFSTYAHEDLSRPPTWDKPVYTLSPEDQIVFSGNTTDSSIQNSGPTKGNSSEIVKNGVVSNISIELIDNTTDGETGTSSLASENFDKLFEVINSVTEVKNGSFVYITPRPLVSSVAYEKLDKAVDSDDLVLDNSIKDQRPDSSST